MEKLKSKQTRDSTATNYHAIWRSFNKFLIRLDKKDLVKTWEERVILFGTHLVEKGTQSQTIKSYFSAIKHILKVDGYHWDDSKAMLSVITKSCRLLNDTVMIRMPIKKKLLEIILFELRRIHNKQPYLEKLYSAAFSLAYYGLLRVGEIGKGSHQIKARDIHVGQNKDKMMIILHSSKTHGKESRPQKIKIEATIPGNQMNMFFCPFKLMRSYLNARGDYKTVNDACFIFRDGTPIKPTHLRKMLRKVLKQLNLKPELYNFHSFRAGRATEMQIFGYSLLAIKTAGRWRSNSAVMKYLKT